MKQNYQFEYQQYADDSALQIMELNLLQSARNACANAYAPYSNFQVGCAILFNDTEIFTGFNFENASYPVGICAERTALSGVITQHPGATINAIAISYNGAGIVNNKPAFPCGMCRQFILECETRNEQSIPLILGGQSGSVIIINSIKDILPFYFTADSMK